MSFYAEIMGALGLSEIAGILDYNIINYGGKAVYIDGFTSIVKIESEQIILNAKKIKITVDGELTVHQLEEKSIIIKGNITSVSVGNS